MKIVTVTTRVDALEDRVVLNVKSAEGKVARLWLTRGLVKRLVPHMLKSVQHQIDAPESASEQMLEVANVYAQLQARVARKPAAAVDVAPDVRPVLVREVSLDAKRNGACSMRLRGTDDVEYHLPLSATEQRQWLETLRRVTDRAGWDLRDWPQWMDQASPQK